VTVRGVKQSQCQAAITADPGSFGWVSRFPATRSSARLQIGAPLSVAAGLVADSRGE
jgi:hypothetical protein